MLKRILAILVAVSMVGLLAACSKAKGGSPGTQNATGKVYTPQSFDGNTGAGILAPVVNSAGEVVVPSQADGAPLKLTTYDATGKKKAEVTTDITDAVTQFALDGKDAAYALTFSDSNAATVHVLDSAGKTAKTVAIGDLPQPGMMITKGSAGTGKSTTNGPEGAPKGVGVNGFAASSDGSLFLAAMGSGVLQYDNTGKQVRAYNQGGLSEITTNEKEQLIVYSMGQGTPTLTTYDTKSGSEAAKVNAPLNNPSSIVYDRAGKRVLYVNSDSIYAVKADGSTGDALVKLTDFNLSGSSRSITGFAIDAAGSLYISSAGGGGATNGMQVKGGGTVAGGSVGGGTVGPGPAMMSLSPSKADRIDKLALVDASSVPQKKVITIAGISSNPVLDAAISAFQTAHPDYKIDVKVYDNQLIGAKQSGQAVDLPGLIQQFNTDIISGNNADIYLLDNLPYYKYIDKGILADLSPMMTGNGLDLSQYYANIFDACKVNGKLYTLPIGFTYNLLAGKASNMPASSTPSVSDFLAGTNTLANGLAVFPKEDTVQAFASYLQDNYGYFVNQSAHTAKFNSPEFIQLLGDFKALIDRKMGTVSEEDKNLYEQVGDGNLAFTPVQLRRLEDLSMAKAFIGDDMKLTNMPTMQSGENNFTVRGLLGISASSPNKEMAWEFLKTLLSTDIQSSQNFDGFPVNKQASADKISKLESNGAMGKGGMRLVIQTKDKQIEAKPLSAQEYDVITANFAKLNTLCAPDANVIQILQEELPSFFSGQKSASDVAGLIQNRVQTILSE